MIQRKLGCRSWNRSERTMQPIAKSGIEQCHWFILPLLLATPTLQFSLDRKQRRHQQNQCSASTLLITTPTTTPSLVKTSLKSCYGWVWPLDLTGDQACSHTFHTKSKFVTGVKIKARDESKLDDNPDSGHLYKNNFHTFQLRISVQWECLCLFSFNGWLTKWLIYRPSSVGHFVHLASMEKLKLRWVSCFKTRKSILSTNYSSSIVLKVCQSGAQKMVLLLHWVKGRG